MRLITKTLLAAAVIAATPMMASADSTFTAAASPITASAHADFSVTIPNFLYVRVGIGTALATNLGVSLIAFNPVAANLANGTAVTATSGGDVSPGVVTAQVIGNNGNNITFESIVPNKLTDGVGGHTISYAQISTALTTGTLAPPALVDNTTTATTLTAVSGVVNQTATWTYTYLNSIAGGIPVAGTYGGANVNNGRVTYTAIQL